MKIGIGINGCVKKIFPFKFLYTFLISQIVFQRFSYMFGSTFREADFFLVVWPLRGGPLLRKNNFFFKCDSRGGVKGLSGRTTKKNLFCGFPYKLRIHLLNSIIPWCCCNVNCQLSPQVPFVKSANGQTMPYMGANISVFMIRAINKYILVYATVCQGSSDPFYIVSYYTVQIFFNTHISIPIDNSKCKFCKCKFNMGANHRLIL